MRVPGRKESGVIFTTVTELPPKERLERSERERPSGSGLERSKDDTAGSKRAGRGPKGGDMKKREEGEKRIKGNGDTRKTLKKCGKIKSRHDFEAERNVNVECACKNANLSAFAQHEYHVYTLTCV